MGKVHNYIYMSQAFAEIRHFRKCLGNCRKTHRGPGWGPGVEPPVRAGEKLAPVMVGIKVR